MAYSQNWLEVEQAMGGRQVLKGTPEEVKAMAIGFRDMLQAQAPPPSDSVTAEDGKVDGVAYRLYKPKDASGPLPVGIWTHGGGFMTGGLDDDDLFCRIVSEHTQSIIVSVDYRLTPEFKAPTQLQDTLTVYKWARQNAKSIGGDPGKFYTIGGSAGGTLALQVANRIVGDPTKRDGISGVAAIMPCVLHPDHVPAALKNDYKAMTENAEGVPLIDKGSMDLFLEHYAAAADDADHFVALSKNHQHFPPVYFVSAEKDPLRDDAKIMEALLKKAGVPTKHDYYLGLPHYFHVISSLPESQTYTANLISGVKWLIGQM